MSKDFLNDEPTFSRSEIAKILNVTPLTIKNREDANKYPKPDRDLNGYRVYSLNDVLNLQIITFDKIDTRPIMSILYDKGWTNLKELGRLMDRAMSRRLAE